MTGRGTALFVEWNCFPGMQLVSLPAARAGTDRGPAFAKASAVRKSVQVTLGPSGLVSKDLFFPLKEGALGRPLALDTE